MPQVSVIMPAKMRTDLEVEWAIEAISSVYAQSFSDWELVFVNDHSPVDPSPLKQYLVENADDRFVGMKVREGTSGVVAARNQGVEASRGRMILPLDADDALPPRSIETLMEAWKGDGIVYGNTILFGRDFQKVFRSRDYSFDRLLNELIMPVGSLHLRSDWEKVGGWNPEMEDGLEDWEYWIRLGAAGVCGHYVDAVTYRYRRRTGGRLRSMKKEPRRYQKAYAKMREIHKELYNGRRPVSCCGDHILSPSKAKQERTVPPPVGDLWVVRYDGHRQGRFGTRGAVTNNSYIIPGNGEVVLDMQGRPAVDPRDGIVMCRNESFTREK